MVLKARSSEQDRSRGARQYKLCDSASKPQDLTKLICEFGDNIGHLVNINELDPRFQVLAIVLPDEFRVCGASEVSGDALVRLLYHDTLTLNAEL